MKHFGFLALILLAITSSALAETYPDKSKTFKIIVPFGPGSGTDLLARALARGMSEVAGLKAFVENKPGAESVIGMVAGKNSPPDGYTIVVANNSTQVLNPLMLPQLQYDPVADFIPLVGIVKYSMVMNAGPTLPFKSVRELIDAARSNPGKYTFASATTSTRAAMEVFERQAGIKLLQVPYKSMADATTALVGGQVQLLMNDVATALPYYKGGQLRPLATTGSTRNPALPNVPTLREEGVADYEMTIWVATYFPAKTPPEVVATARDILSKAAKTQTVVDAMAIAKFEPLQLTGDQLTALQRTESDKWGKVLRPAARTGPR